MRDLVREVGDFLKEQQLPRPRETLLVAVSGGRDSMVLLDLLHRVCGVGHLRLLVGHFNHQLRGEASRSDEAFVKAAARRRRLRCVVGRGDVVTFAKRNKLSLEMAARQLRHAFLARTARRWRSSAVALAHQADDQVELLFLRLLRGSGGAGLAGMRPCSPSPADSRVRLVRPLLTATRAELAAYAARRGVRFREDASNAGEDFLRNRIRHRLLPLLEAQFQPGVCAVARRIMEVVGAEADCVSGLAEAWLASRRRTPFQHLHPAVGRAIVRSELRGLGVTPDFDLIEHLRLRPGCPMCAAPHVSVLREDSGHVRALDPAAPSFDPDVLAVSLAGARGQVHFAGCSVDWRLETGRRARSRPQFGRGVEFFDADGLGEGITLRHWRAGDRFQPIGMKAPVKLQDLFVNAGVPRSERHQRVVAATSDGRIFWVEGLRIGEGFKLDKPTIRRLKWRWRRDKAAVARGAGA